MLKDLIEEQEKVLHEARAHFDEIGGGVSESRAKELEEMHDKAMKRYDELDEKINRSIRIEEAQRKHELRQEEILRQKRPTISGSSSHDGNQIDYRTAFLQYIGSKFDGAAPLSAEAHAVLLAGRSGEARAQVTATPAAGGYMVPTTLQEILIKRMAVWGPMFGGTIATDLITASGNPIQMPTVNDTASTLVTGTEGVAFTDDGGSDVVIGQKELNAYEYNTEWIRISKALIDDSILGIEAVIGDLLAERIARFANAKLTTGTGTGEPNGVVTAAVASVTSAAVDAVTFDEIIDLQESVDQAYQDGDRVGFMFNQSTRAALRKVKNLEGDYIWQAANVARGTPEMVLDKPVYLNNAMPSLGTGNKPIVFGDFSKYYVRKVGEPLVAAISDKDFHPGAGISGYVRFDGELADDAALKSLQNA